MQNKKVAIVMGSDSDWSVVKSACGVLKDFGIEYEARILSAHRTPAAAAEFAKNARANGFGVILCAAGMAAHLAGAFAANTTLPVIGIPMKGGAMDGMDALLATVQMPSGFPVATVALNGAKNAAYLAVAILAVADPDLTEKLEKFRADTGRRPSPRRMPPSGPRLPHCKIFRICQNSANFISDRVCNAPALWYDINKEVCSPCNPFADRKRRVLS